MNHSALAPSRISELSQSLSAFGATAHARDWVPATSGNLSARIDENTALMTISGSHLGHLQNTNFMPVNLQNEPQGPGRPSAETGLHTMLYRQDANIGAVLHIHSARATVLSMREERSLRFSGYEILKAFPGIETHDCSAEIPIYPNDQDIPRLVQHIEAAHTEAANESTQQAKQLPAFLIAGHGIYAWGEDVASTANQLEALDFLFQCALLSSPN